jgi:uncharacterized protein (TIGR03083 family)
MADKHEAHRRVVEKLEAQGAEIGRLCAGLEEEAIAKRPKPDKWSVKEVLAHITRIQEVFEGRVEALLTQENPPIVSYSPERDVEFAAVAARPSTELLKLFKDGRSRLVARLIALSPGDWHRPGTHPDYPSYDVHFCMEYMAHHEAHHIFQMFERRAAFAAVAH